MPRTPVPNLGPDQLRALWATPAPAYGLWSTMGDSRSPELAARTGYDWVGLDAQHGALTEGQVLDFLRGAEGSGIPTLVRTRGGDPDMLGWLLDVGADGVIVPMVESRSQAQALVRATRYPPLGARSFGPVRAFERGVPAPAAYAHRPLVFAMIETAAAVENVQDIASVEGLDGLFVGPGDLAVSLGRAPSLDLPDAELDGLIRRVGQAAQDNGLVSGIYSGSVEVLHRYRQAGFQLMVVTSDMAAYAAGIDAALGKART
ncbi:HpcH/HpaI aldolase family protein [Paeniglutamicibacter cryotolerans]|uniref:2-keto-3-deoxy-L-rhamnonate aldolase RhmA n=1 Tax=Paeniglutamicibacter cryotolerans TaxID=670079 RepID=A0A839QUE4_9MICC|nr:aldolase/citrate lyase family protein [Paeniglutamicibacter cryotolerans]MBB2995641.1 2-keto-3-deoxy-L-rhamnonate aldolase RhmA [Paeniglutamicibacter cryotolerans]